MTCIAAIVDKDKCIHMAGDSFSANSQLNGSVVTNLKVFKKNGLLFGFTSSWRMGQILQHGITYPKQKESEKTVEEYMMKSLLPAISKGFAKYGWDLKDDDGAKRGGCFLIGYKGRLFTVQEDFSFLENANGISAIGCGGEVAIGALAALTKSKITLSPPEILETALQAAVDYGAGVRGPFVFLKLEKK